MSAVVTGEVVARDVVSPVVVSSGRRDTGSN